MPLLFDIFNKTSKLSLYFSYHSGKDEDWGRYLGGVLGGRIVAVKLIPKSINHAGKFTF